MSAESRRRSGSRRRDRLAGAAVMGAATLWLAAPWLERWVYGTRPYDGTAFDVLSLGAWLVLLGGLVAFARARSAAGRLLRASVGTLAVGMGAVAVVLARSVLTFVAAGFRPVPTSGGDPATLVVVWAFVLGFGCAVLGLGGLGLALWRRGGGPIAAVFLAAPALPAAVLVLDFLSALPPTVGRVLVGTNLLFLPFGVAWLALGYLLRVDTGTED